MYANLLISIRSVRISNKEDAEELRRNNVRLLVSFLDFGLFGRFVLGRYVSYN